MGPIILFDKSFLQSLSVDESVLFDHFFFPAICPLFFVETLADLEKAVRQGRTPEQEVGIIAQKTPEMSGAPIMHHSSLALGNLLGGNVPMDGRVPTPGGTPVKFEGKPGILHGVAPEAEAFSRWQKGEFLHVERHHARVWREGLAAIDLNAVAAGMKAMGIDQQVCKSLSDAKKIAVAFLQRKDTVPDRIKLGCILLGGTPEYERIAVQSWRAHGAHSLAEYAPYAAHVISIELFFQIALAANLVGTMRASNRVDIAYLFYLPFCQVFVSRDRLHERCAPHFLRADQTFVWGDDLKAELHRLAEHYLKLPEEQREQGLMRFARTPPPDDAGSLVAQLWDCHLNASWRSRSGPAPPRDASLDAKVIAQLNRFSDAQPIPPAEVDFDPAEAEMVQVKRQVHKRKGSFWQLPKDIQDDRTS
jgi:hypothetical protein